MAKILRDEALSFDDVLLVPQRFDGGSRKDIDISTDVAGLKLSLPVISSNMPAVTEAKMCVDLAGLGGLGILHRMADYHRLGDIMAQINDQMSIRSHGYFGGSIGIGLTWEADARHLIEGGASIICIDVAHGFQKNVLEVCRSFRRVFGDFPLIVGNFATKDALRYFVENGNEFFDFQSKHPDNTIFKIGIGGGSACSTRVATGCGYPTFQSTYDCANLGGFNCIADGGIKNSGDIVKSLAAGAKAVMLGSLLAATNSSPGEVKNGKKLYYGNASARAKQNYFGNTDHVEGEEASITYQGHIEKVVYELAQGIRSGLSYCGANNLEQLRKNATFAKITSLGYAESQPHALYRK